MTAARVNARGKARIKQVFRCVGTAKEQSGARALRPHLLLDARMLHQEEILWMH